MRQVLRHVLMTGFLYGAFGHLAWSQPIENPSLETIVSRLVQAKQENQARLRPYSVTRSYTLFGKERDVSKSHVVAEVKFVPPDLKEYLIAQASGVHLGETITRKMLESEKEIVRHQAVSSIEPANYEFRFIGEEAVDGQRCYRLDIRPLRKDKNLLSGTIWVDANTYLTRRIEGAPADGPSWWLRDIHIVLRYDDVDGMWLQTASEASAQVRLLGRHTMVSRDLKYNIGGTVALARSSPSAASE